MQWKKQFISAVRHMIYGNGDTEHAS